MAQVKRNIIVTPGVQPDTDFTTTSTPHFVNADKIRFRDGYPEKIGGFEGVTIEDDDPINGCLRSIYSYNLSNNVNYLLGTNSNLYYLFGSALTNITPIETSTTAIPNSLDSNYGTLANDPLSTVSGSNEITVSDPGTIIGVGDTIELSGATGFNGIPAGELNTDHFIRTQTTNSYTFVVSGNASSTGSGGGAAVVQETPIITVNQTAHGYPEGARILIASATGFAGIPAGDINKEHIIRTVTTNAYDIVVDTIATSSVSGGGGAATTVQGEIADGLCDATSAQGYGAGLYGVGLYGISKTSSSGEIDARTWSFDRFGNDIVMNPGVQTGVYTWDSNASFAPTLLTNAPTEVDYVFVSNEIVVTLGASDTPARIQWSDQGNSTVWTPLATNQAGQDDIEQAAKFISHINLKRINLLFTQSQVYTFRYIGRPLIWETRLLDDKSGIIGKNARVQHNGIAYWMGSDNFYYYKSGNVEIIPSNTTNETTLKRFVYENITTSQTSKIFAWYNRDFNEVWWHYPSETSGEPDLVVRLNVKELTWTLDTFDRSAGEYPTQLRTFPYLGKVNDDDETSDIFQHEKGADADGVAMPFSLSTHFFDTGLDTANTLALEPDSLQVGDITCTVNVKKYAQSSQLYGSRDLTIEPTTEVLSYRLNSRYIQYVISGNELGQTWRAGNWQENLSKGGRR